MDLPNQLTKLKSSSDEPKKFIAVEIGLDVVKAAIWQSTGNHTEILSIGSTQTWSNSSQEELLSAIDTSLADAQGSNPDDSIKQVIFGVPNTWVDSSGLFEDKKGLLKAICHQFDFKAVGFVVTTEAMAHHLRNLEGGPPSVILLQISSSQIAVSLIYLGQLESTQMIDRTTTLTADIEEGIARLPHSGNLPSRIIYLTNQDDPEPIKQELISYDWQQKLSFLHLPQIEALPRDWSIKAVAITGGSEVIQSLAPEPPKPNLPPVLGFKPVALPKPEPEPSMAELDNLESVEPPAPPKISKPKFKFKLPKLFLPAMIIVGVTTLALAGFFAYRTLPKAIISVNIGMNPYQQQLDFVLDPAATSPDLDNSTLSATKTNITVSGSKTIPTTGTRLVGDRAKGKIMLYNRTTAPKTLKAGTTIKANNLRFTLDSATTIASASTKENADFSLTTEPSKAEAQVTSADIGEQYNLPKDTQFSVDNYSSDSFFAVSSQTFIGGSAQSVSAVAADDLTNLKTELMAELVNQFGASQAGQIAVGQPEILTQKFSAAKNDEADNLSLELSLSQSIYQYQAADLSVVAQTLAAASLPDAQVKTDDTQINILSTNVDSDGKAKITAQVILYYIPRINSDGLVGDLTNLNLAQLDSKISLIPGYRSHTLTKKLLVFNRLPSTPKQIELRLIPTP